MQTLNESGKRPEFQIFTPIGGRRLEVLAAYLTENEDPAIYGQLYEMLGSPELDDVQHQALNELAEEIGHLLDTMKDENRTKRMQRNELLRRFQNGNLLRNSISIIVQAELDKVLKKQPFSAANEDGARRKAVSEIVNVILSTGESAEETRIGRILWDCFVLVGQVRERAKRELDVDAQKRPGVQTVPPTILNMDGLPVCEEGQRIIAGVMEYTTLPQGEESLPEAEKTI